MQDIQIRSVGYDRRRGRLEIEFTWTDDVRQFYPVAPALYRQLLAAKPMYLFLHQNLVRYTDYQELRPDRRFPASNWREHVRPSRSLLRKQINGSLTVVSASPV
jgi:KTSC domain